jgi:hypothetical protein
VLSEAKCCNWDEKRAHDWWLFGYGHYTLPWKVDKQLKFRLVFFVFALLFIAAASALYADTDTSTDKGKDTPKHSRKIDKKSSDGKREGDRSSVGRRGSSSDQSSTTEKHSTLEPRSSARQDASGTDATKSRDTGSRSINPFGHHSTSSDATTHEPVIRTNSRTRESSGNATHSPYGTDKAIQHDKGGNPDGSHAPIFKSNENVITKPPSKQSGSFFGRARAAHDAARPVPTIFHTWNDSSPRSHGVIPSGAPRIVRRGGHYDQVVHRIGLAPTNRYYFTPRRGGNNRRVVVDMYYPHYYSVWRPHYYRPVYYRWGWCPEWIGAVFIESEFFYHVPHEVIVDRNGVEDAIDDIQAAWINGDLTLISSRLGHDKVRIYTGTSYQYSLSADDFNGMTADQLANIQTDELSFDDPLWLSSREVWVSGMQTFNSLDSDETDTMYLAFRLRKRYSNWEIVGFYSSDQPIRCPYTVWRR